MTRIRKLFVVTRTQELVVVAADEREAIEVASANYADAECESRCRSLDERTLFEREHELAYVARLDRDLETLELHALVKVLAEEADALAKQEVEETRAKLRESFHAMEALARKLELPESFWLAVNLVQAGLPGAPANPSSEPSDAHA
jgi:hypothetical protein